MGYYDCKDCGNPLGQEYGFCEKCTPKTYLDFREGLREAEILRGGMFVYGNVQKIFTLLYTIENYEKYVKAVEDYNLNKPSTVQPEEFRSVEELKQKLEESFNVLREYADVILLNK